jgi:nicotinamide-nucleotide amidase
MARGSIAGIEKDRISIAVTGVAGPGSSERKPEGLVWIASYKFGSLITAKLELGEIGRKNIRDKATRYALRLLYKNLTI